MMQTSSLVGALMLGLASAQTPDGAPEVHPKITTWQCTKEGGCVKQTNKIVLDSLYHPIYQVDAPEYDCGAWGEAANSTACPDVESCQSNCKQAGIADYSKFGIETDGDALLLEQLAPNGTLLTPRVYLLKEDAQEYEMLQLTGGEFSFDVDVSKLPCGMNGALYLSEMAADGGKSEVNQAGAYHGTGYCDAQCYTTPFINGAPNLEGYGSCCNEMDIWEANSRANTYVPHPCNVSGLVECEGEACEWGGICDKWGCGFNPYQLGNPDYYGPDDDFKVDTSRPFTVVSQFPADDNGKLIEYRRFYVQDGKKIPQAAYNLEEHDEELGGQNWIDDEFCRVRDAERYQDLGAATAMGDAMARGMVLALSIWWDVGGNMTWLDGLTDGVGPCRDGEGAPEYIESVQPDTAVIFSKIKWGELDSTYKLKCKSKSS